MDDSTVLLSDANLQVVERITTGIVDQCFGGGVSRTSVNLLGGDPGAGKTTLSLQLSDVFAGFYQREVLYIANEQHAPEIKETAERLHLKNMKRIRIVKAMGGVMHDIGSMLLHFEPCLTILDSVTKWSGEDMREAVVICQRLKDYTVRLNAPTIVVNQVTKSGDHSGLNQMQHAVDSTMLFEILGENPGDPRRLLTRKNRNGPAPVSQYYDMTALGLVGITEEEAMLRLQESPQESKKSELEEIEDEDSED
jgi:DNA repair protein RadA/Sms